MKIRINGLAVKSETLTELTNRVYDTYVDMPKITYSPWVSYPGQNVRG